MPKPVYGRFKQPGSIAQLTRGRGWNSELTGFLLPFAMQDYLYIQDDFNGTLNGDIWTLGTDGGSTAFAAGDLVGGNLRGVTEAASGDYILIRTTRENFDAAYNPGFEIREKRNVITEQKWEVGWSDPLTDDTLPATNDIDTPTITNGATDVAVIVQDTAQTLTTCAFLTDGTTGAASKTNLDTSFIPTINVYERKLVQLIGGNQAMAVWNNLFDQAVTRTQGPDAAVLVRPHFVLGTLNAAITVDIDYIRIWSERI